jgi:rubrerythrin
MNFQKIFEYALQREKEGYRFFKTSADKSSHAAAAQVFQRLADEELKHIEYLKDLMKSEDDGEIQTEAMLNIEDWFESKAKEELLDQSLIESMIPDVAVLRTAYLIEGDLSDFYEKTAENSSGRARKAFQQLAKWERKHEAFFKQLHDKVFEQYTQMPWGG